MKTLYGLYAITDGQLIAETRFAESIEQALLGGARLIQYRDKSQDQDKRQQQAQTIKQLCDQYQAISIINDDLELALAVDADGLHIGRNDGDLEQVRQQLGADKIIGVSCYNDLQLAIEAQQKGANYVAFGSFFPSSTKPNAKRASVELLLEARQKITIPICSIGGITLTNANQLLAAGTDMLAIINGVFGQADIHAASQAFQIMIESTTTRV